MVSSGFSEKIRQDEDFGIHVMAKDNTERVQPITYDAKHGLTRKSTADEIRQLRSLTQSLAWIARQTRPDLSYRISKVQSTFENACVRDLRECNRTVEYATSTSTRVIYFSRLFLGRCSRRDYQRRQFLPRTGANRRSYSEISTHNRLVSLPWLLVTR